MSETQETTFTPLPLEDIPHFWLDNGAPCFVGTLSDICKHVEAHGFQIYYVMGTEVYESISTGNSNIKTTERRPQIFKVFTSIMGRAQIPIGAKEVKFAELKADAWFNLPKIPYYLVQKIDDFFRLNEANLKTESIVLLTYDSTKSGPEGWGVLVPDQENTGADCDYKPESVADAKPDHVYIVGSAHSHPSMAAYASGKDHKDQDGNDGLHITFGWQAHVNRGQTQYHIEFQMGGHSFPFTPDQIFEAMPAREPDDEVKEWSTKVTKKSYNSQNHHGTSTGTNNQFKHGGTGTTFSNPSKNVKTPPGCPSPHNNIIIGEVGEADKQCCFCQASFISVDRKKRRCMSCHQYLCFPDDQLADVVEAREKSGVYSSDIDTVRGKPDKSIYIWRRITAAINAPDEELFEKVYTPSGKSLAVGSK